MRYEGKIDFARSITLNGKPHGVEYLINKPTWVLTSQGKVIFVESENKVYIGTNTAWLELTPNPATHNHDDRYYTITAIDNMFSVTTGHDHDGVNSRLISYGSLSGVPAKFLPTSHGNESHTSQYLVSGDITYSLLSSTRGLVGTGITQVAQGNHNHDVAYFLRTDLTPTTGATLVGANILGATTIQAGLDALNSKFANYYTSTTVYTKSETDGKYISSTASSSDIIGDKGFDGSLSVKTGAAPRSSLDVKGDSNSRHIIIGDNVTPRNNILIDANKKYSGDLTAKAIFGNDTILDVDFDSTKIPTSILVSKNELVLRTANNSSLDINVADNKFSGAGAGNVNSISILKSTLSQVSSSTVSAVKLIETEASINSGSISSLSALYINSITGSVELSSLQNNYGIYINSINYGTNKYSIFTNLGKVRFGDTVSINGSLMVEADNTFDLGDSTHKFKSLYLNSIYIGDKSIVLNNDLLSINNGVVTNRILIDTDLNSYYTKTDLSVSNPGTVTVHWNNISNKPALADSNWMDIVSTEAVFATKTKTESDVWGVIESESLYMITGGLTKKIASSSWSNSTGISYNDSLATSKTNVNDALDLLVGHKTSEWSNVNQVHGITLAVLGGAKASDVTILQSQMTAANSNITTSQGNITSITTRVTDLETAFGTSESEEIFGGNA